MGQTWSSTIRKAVQVEHLLGQEASLLVAMEETQEKSRLKESLSLTMKGSSCSPLQRPFISIWNEYTIT